MSSDRLVPRVIAAYFACAAASVLMVSLGMIFLPEKYHLDVLAFGAGVLSLGAVLYLVMFAVVAWRDS